MDGGTLATLEGDQLIAWLSRRHHDFERLIRRMNELEWNRGDAAYQQTVAAIAAIRGIIDGVCAARKRERKEPGW